MILPGCIVLNVELWQAVLLNFSHLDVSLFLGLLSRKKRKLYENLLFEFSDGIRQRVKLNVV